MEVQTKKLKDLKVIDIIQMPAFEDHIKRLMGDLRGTELKMGPIERLVSKGVYNPKAFVALYVKILNKDLNTSEYPSTLRTFIKRLCEVAFCRTVEQILGEESKQQITPTK